MKRAVSFLTLSVVAGLLAACSEGEKEGVFKSIGARAETPVEFGVLPHHPLELPEDVTELPVPNPGGRSRTDITPVADALVALGGAPTGGISARPDAAILAATGANKAQPDIRRVLSEDDAEFQNGNQGRLLDRVFNRNTESVTYERMILDAEREAQRLRAKGLRTSGFPPASAE